MHIQLNNIGLLLTVAFLVGNLPEKVEAKTAADIAHDVAADTAVNFIALDVTAIAPPAGAAIKIIWAGARTIEAGIDGYQAGGGVLAAVDATAALAGQLTGPAAGWILGKVAPFVSELATDAASPTLAAIAKGLASGPAASELNKAIIDSGAGAVTSLLQPDRNVHSSDPQPSQDKVALDSSILDAMDQVAAANRDSTPLAAGPSSVADGDPFALSDQASTRDPGALSPLALVSAKPANRPKRPHEKPVPADSADEGGLTDVTVSQRAIDITLTDHEIVDGDIVTLRLNGNPVVEAYVARPAGKYI